MAMKRLYSLFKKVNGKWIRQSGPALHKEQAVRAYQSLLLGYSMQGVEVQLRPVEPLLRALRAVEDDVPLNEDGYPQYEDGPMCSQAEHSFRHEACLGE